MSSTKQTLLVLAVLLVLVMPSQGLPSQAYLTSHKSYQELINVYEDIQALTLHESIKSNNFKCPQKSHTFFKSAYLWLHFDVQMKIRVPFREIATYTF